MENVSNRIRKLRGRMNMTQEDVATRIGVSRVIIENTGLLGVPLPSALKKWFEALRNKNDTGGSNDGTSGH